MRCWYIDRLKETIKRSLIWSSIFTTVSAIIYFVFAKQIVGIFSTDPEVLDIRVRALRAIVLFRKRKSKHTFQSLFMARKANRDMWLEHVNNQSLSGLSQ